METDGLFSLSQPNGTQVASPATGFAAPSADSPLPVRMRPAGLDELVGQEHLLAPGSPLRQLVTGSSPMSVILWGPPGTGKTTIAHLVAAATNRKFVAMSALTAGVKDVRAVIDTARRERQRGGPPTVLFIDEVHRFSKTQQDSLLAAVEDRTVTLLAATTENPYFSIISPLLSRCVLLTLQALGDEDVRRLVRRAVTDERGLGGQVTLSAEAEDHLVRLASGDVRKALTALEAAASSAAAQGASEIDLATAEKAVDVAAVRYDRDGDAHYDVTSAFIKSMRGSDPDAALHWLARMLVAGEDPRFIARRIVIFASEDVGMADPQALVVATAAAQAVQLIGLPECQLNLAQAVVHMATAPKSNSVTTALGSAMADVRAGRGGAVPAHLRDAHYPGARGLGHGRGYRYPHDDPRGVVTQQYIPDDLTAAEYYRPTDHGSERAVSERVPRLRRIVRGLPAPARPAAASTVPPAEAAPASAAAAPPPSAAAPAPSAAASAETADRAAGGGSGPDASRSSVSTEPSAGSAEPPAGTAEILARTTDDSGEAAGKEQP
ncbi:replication-associated recombination protein A [Actinoplanes sp. CA-030573]|uniref:replication-associated recombination protein A n=1 Tax=Actinoplanes sp. CA-030573 TaxID=3239898 RepID=UPI003D901110